VVRGFRTYCAEALRLAAALGGVMAMLLAVALLLQGELSLTLNIDLEFSRWDALWILLLLPLTAIAIATLTAPLAWLFLRAGAAMRRH